MKEITGYEVIAMKNYVNDMTKGNPTRLLLSFTMPMLVGNLFQQFYNIVDSIIVGQFVGADALAAVGATGSVNFLIFRCVLEWRPASAS